MTVAISARAARIPASVARSARTKTARSAAASRSAAGRLKGQGAALRAELIGALLLGMGVMRSIVGSPALSEASFEQTRRLVARLVHALSAE